MKKWTLPALVLMIAALVAVWWEKRPPELPEGFASGNGRIEATEIDIATQSPGRILEILAREGDFVKAGSVLAAWTHKCSWPNGTKLNPGFGRLKMPSSRQGPSWPNARVNSPPPKRWWLNTARGGSGRQTT